MHQLLAGRIDQASLRLALLGLGGLVALVALQRLGGRLIRRSVAGLLACATVAIALRAVVGPAVPLPAGFGFVMAAVVFLAAVLLA